MENKDKITFVDEEYLLNNDFIKWGRDDIPNTVNYEKGNIRLTPLQVHGNYTKEDKGYGYLWVKDNENDIFSWRLLVIIKYINDLKILENVIK